MHPTRGATVAAVLAGLAACATPPRGFDSPVPSARVAAIVDAAARKDRAAVPRLIECLTSDDPAVRLAAIRALERITGQTLGYEHAAAEWRRREMVRSWISWYERERGGDQGPAESPRADRTRP